MKVSYVPRHAILFLLITQLLPHALTTNISGNSRREVSADGDVLADAKKTCFHHTILQMWEMAERISLTYRIKPFNEEI